MALPNRDDYEVELSIKRIAEDHPGYCSGTDNDDITTTVTEYKRRRSCPKRIKKNDVDGEMNITNPDIINKFSHSPSLKTEYHGNGHCGCKTTYHITRAQIVRKVNFPFDE